MEYTVIEHHNLREFVERVNQAIAKGWRPQGSASVAYHYSGSASYVQAMVKEDK